MFLKYNKGFTLIETLLVLLIYSFFISLNSTFLYKLNILSPQEFLAQDLISSYQLRHVFMLSKNINLIEEDLIEFNYFNDERYLKILSDKIVMGEGTVIFFNNIKEGYFEIIKKEIYLYLKRDIEFYKILIGEINE